MKYKPRKLSASPKHHSGRERNITVRVVSKDVPEVHTLARALLNLKPAEIVAVLEEHDDSDKLS